MRIGGQHKGKDIGICQTGQGIAEVLHGSFGSDGSRTALQVDGQGAQIFCIVDTEKIRTGYLCISERKNKSDMKARFHNPGGGPLYEMTGIRRERHTVIVYLRTDHAYSGTIAVIQKSIHEGNYRRQDAIFIIRTGKG